MLKINQFLKRSNSIGEKGASALSNGIEKLVNISHFELNLG